VSEDLVAQLAQLPHEVPGLAQAEQQGLGGKRPFQPVGRLQHLPQGQPLAELGEPLPGGKIVGCLPGEFVEDVLPAFR
jgi:hypothetical protein